MDRLQSMLRMGGQGMQPDTPAVDTSEQIYISSLALLKMLKHGRAGVPMEVMGLMLGEFVDDYTVRVVDVFAMPQSGTGVSVEAVDPVFQTKMLDMLKQTGRPEMVVGWYHSHPGFGCWLSGTASLFLLVVAGCLPASVLLLTARAASGVSEVVNMRRYIEGKMLRFVKRSRRLFLAVQCLLRVSHRLTERLLVVAGVDVNTQQSFEALNQRAVAVVVDPIQSVKGKVVIDAFRSINPQMTMMGYEPRQTTSIIGHLNKPSIQALIHGLNRHYYSIAISYRKSELEEKMLMNLHKKGWTEGLKTADFKQHDKQNEETVKRMLELAKAYNKAVQEEDEKTAEKFHIHQVPYFYPPPPPFAPVPGSFCLVCQSDPGSPPLALLCSTTGLVLSFASLSSSYSTLFSSWILVCCCSGGQAGRQEALAAGHRDSDVKQHYPVLGHHA